MPSRTITQDFFTEFPLEDWDKVIPLNSSRVLAGFYKPDQKYLIIIFKDRDSSVYLYRNIPSTTWVKLIKATSFGKTLQKLVISTDKPYQRILDQEALKTIYQSYHVTLETV